MPLVTKSCKECGEVKPLTDYSAHKMMADGHLNICKECKKAYMRKYRRAKGKYGTRSEYDATRAALAAGPYERQRKYRLKNLAYFAERASYRNAAQLQATPPWLTDDQKWMLLEIYELRQQRQELTGVEHHVDHIIPLLGKEARGLHVPWNLRVVPAEINLRKSNKVEF